jgi:hypothetical protein
MHTYTLPRVGNNIGVEDISACIYVCMYLYMYLYVCISIYRTLPRVGNNIGVEDISAEADEPKGIDLVVE